MLFFFLSFYLQIVRPHERQDDGDARVGHKDDEQAQANGKWDGPSRILRLLAWNVERRRLGIECP